MKDNVVQYEGRQAVDGAPRESALSHFMRDLPEEYMLIPGILIGLVVSFVTIFGSRRILNLILPDVGSGNSELDRDFNAELGIKEGVLSGLPVKYKWVPAVRRRHPAALDIEFTVNNARGVRMHIHKEGVFNKPLGAIPLLGETPPLIDSHGYVLRLEPPDALKGREAGFDEAMATVCGAGLYEATLEGGKLSVIMARSVTFEIEETRLLLERAAKAASLFN